MENAEHLWFFCHGGSNEQPKKRYYYIIDGEIATKRNKRIIWTKAALYTICNFQAVLMLRTTHITILCCPLFPAFNSKKLKLEEKPKSSLLFFFWQEKNLDVDEMKIFLFPLFCLASFPKKPESLRSISSLKKVRICTYFLVISKKNPGAMVMLYLRSSSCSKKLVMWWVAQSGARNILA